MRLIDADALEKRAYDDLHYRAKIEDWEFDVITNYLDTSPTIEAEPVKHGRWILHDNGSGTCDQCRFTQKNVWDDDNQQNYCGVCGAKMDGGDAG